MVLCPSLVAQRSLSPSSPPQKKKKKKNENQYGHVAVFPAGKPASASALSSAENDLFTLFGKNCCTRHLLLNVLIISFLV